MRISGGFKNMVDQFALFSTKQFTNKLKFLPYVLVGIAVFALNSNPENHPYLQIYITLLEAKLGIAAVYFLSKKLGKINKEKHST